MALGGDSWMHEYDEVAKLAKEIAGMTSERSSLHATGPDAQRYLFALKSKILVFGTRLDALEFHLSNQPLSEEEMNHRKEMVADLRAKMYQMPLTMNLNVFTTTNRNSLLDLEIEQANAMNRDGLDSSEILQLQRQTIRAQDEELDKLAETIRSTNQIAWAINEEFRLHERLTIDENIYVEVPDSRLQVARRRIAMLNRRRGSCSSLWLLLLSLTAILALAALIYMLNKYL